ncbi:MAG: zinc-dependent metalloprotease family protein [Bacteroidota bacterium]|nr:zinc-dependent metalloprotease family protein [Bacteroidota bacterium]
MKSYLIILILFFSACSKNFDKPANKNPSGSENAKGPQRCDFGITQFNQIKRAPVDEGANRRPVRQPPGGTANSVILLDFDGHIVSNTSWNYNGDINCAPANLTRDEINEVIDRVSNDYSPFNVTVTTSQSEYDAANPYKRMRVIVTETYEWFGQSGGVSFIGSFTWGNNTPCFVFSSLLNYNIKKITEAVSHEVGHTFGLYHQSTYDVSCINISEYNYGQGTGETGWAPIMGLGYYRNVTLWYNGPNSYGCSNLQDEVPKIANAVGGMRNDDYPDSRSQAPLLRDSLDGLINTNTDVDFFYVNINSTKNISLDPFSIGANNEGANLDLLLKIYNRTGNLLFVVDNTSTLNVATTLNPGRYYLAVSTTANQFAGTYGMLGWYSISLL